MPTRADITYFGAGPAALPTDVLEIAAHALLDYNGTGLGIAEHSHRSELATNIINEAKADLANFLDIPTDQYEVVFMQAGGTGEFAASVYNLVGAWVARQHAAVLAELGSGADEAAVVAALKDRVEKKLKVDYIITGGWSLKAYQEAVRLLGPEYVNVAADARTINDGKFGKIPDPSTWKLSEDAALVYYCDNETVDGVEFPEFPSVLAPRPDGTGPVVVADMSSNILSRRIPVSNYSLLFFGAQKNLGCTGVTVAVVKKSLLPPTTSQPAPALLRKLGLPIPPIMLVYETIAKNNSLYNTLSIFEWVFPVYLLILSFSDLDSLASSSPARSSRSS
jgi:phosphoserine aminotransferase